MTNLAKQKELAAHVLKVGKGRVWIDTEATEEVMGALTRANIRELIDEGIIKKKNEIGVSRGRARVLAKKKALGRRKGHGSRKGAKGARGGKKRQWITKIRALRYRLKELRDEGDVDKTVYHKLYRKAKGGEIRNVSHLNDIVSNYKKEAK